MSRANDAGGSALAPSRPTTNGSTEAGRAVDALPIVLDRRVVARVLTAAIVLLLCMHVTARVAQHFLPEGRGAQTIRLFNLDEEVNIPSFFSACLLLACAGVLGWIAAGRRTVHDRFAKAWAGLSAGFLYLAIDEAASLHEILDQRLPAALVQGVLRFEWVVFAIPAVIIIALIYFRFLLHLPPPSRRRFILAGLVYLGGALGLEMAGALVLDTSGGTLGFEMLKVCEEGAEMAGAALFLLALLRHAALTGGLSLVLPPQASPIR